MVGQSYAFHHQINGDLRRIILLLNEDVEARDIPGFMKTSDGIRRKLHFQEKIFYCGRCHSKHTFHEGCPSDQEDEEQQPPTEQNENREQQDLPEATPEVHWNPETPSERNEVEQNDAALGQSTTQEGGAEATPGDGSELESDCPSAGDETQQQPDTVVQGEQVGEANETATDKQKRETLTAIPPDLLKTEDLIQGNPHSHGMGNKGTGTPRVVPKRKRSWEDSNPVAKRGSRHG